MGERLMARRMLRYQVVVNDRPQTFRLGGTPVHVEGARVGVGPDTQHVVWFWAEGAPDFDEIEYTFQVFGTGHPLPEGAQWWGTTARTPEGLVWHLYQVSRQEQA
ncbi:hypothetical protein ABZ897_00745 [Nonomuraea sp. NPDC046802]|uniref:DUF7352 domain-containing protein n=1 Tax=Nonomuraea sp. NPDC046802 TaxID=3154919 RepID=UPI0033CE22DB